MSIATHPRRPLRTLPDVARAFFGFGSPRLLATQAIVALALRPLAGDRPGVRDLVVVAAVVAYWPLQEWLLHRWVLHARPLRIGRRVLESAAARKHRQHHEEPLDLQATLLPTATIAVLVPIHVAAWIFLAPSLGVAATGIASLGCAALLYEWIHFLTHTAYRPRTRWFARVKRQHMAHHHRDPARWFAFTLPQLDEWLGTGTRADCAAPQDLRAAPVSTGRTPPDDGA